MSLSQAQLDLLQEFEEGLDPRWPERNKIPAVVLGYGEISTVFAIEAQGLKDLAIKRLPLFYGQEEVEAYQVAYEEYNHLLQGVLGLQSPSYSFVSFANSAGRPIFYIIQRRLPSSSIGSQAIHLLPTEQVRILVRRVLQEARRVWDFNRQQDRLQVALDGQISNPLYRIEGVEQLNAELFLRSDPSFLAWILRLFFLEDVVARYYDFRRVVIDLVVNFYKEQRPDLIPGVIDEVNGFFRDEAAALGIQPIEEAEVRSYYREDALIWTLYLAFRRIDRWLQTQLLRREYPYILPGKIQR